MSKSKSTRSRKIKTESGDEESNGNKNHVKAKGLHKVLFMAESTLKNPKNLRLERFYCPGRGGPALYLTRTEDPKEFSQIVEFAEPRRAWLLNSNVCSDGRIFLTLPIDLTFLALHHLRKHCTQKAIALDNIYDEKDPSTSDLLMNFVQPERLACVADVKKAGDTHYYKYNAQKTLAWLALKTRRVAAILKTSGVHCGQSSLSQNYTRSELSAEELIDDMDYLRMAADIVGESIDMDLHDELVSYLEIPQESLGTAKTDANAKTTKRKSLKTLNASENKKIKLDNVGAAQKLQNSSLLDESLDEGAASATSPPTLDPLKAGQKDRSLTAKEKALAKGAKGTKSIASFFKK